LEDAEWEAFLRCRHGEEKLEDIGEMGMRQEVQRPEVGYDAQAH
jgi:hypothetical protein